MKKTLSFIISLCMLSLIFATTINAFDISSEESITYPTTSLSKVEFAEQHRNANINNAKRVLTDAEINDALLLYYETGNSRHLDVLKSNGLYLYSTSYDISSKATSQPSDIEMGQCSILYDARYDQWQVRFVGNWRTVSPISDEVHVWFNPGVGSTMNVGGYDSVGIVFYNTSGTAPNKIDSYATIRSSDRATAFEISTPATHDDSTGIAFQYQDYIICRSKSSPFTYTWDYVGAIFETVIVFDSSFENFNGYAKGFYAHTWKSSSIASIGTGWINFDISWLPENYSFGCYSNIGTAF